MEAPRAFSKKPNQSAPVDLFALPSARHSFALQQVQVPARRPVVAAIEPIAMLMTSRPPLPNDQFGRPQHDEATSTVRCRLHQHLNRHLKYSSVHSCADRSKIRRLTMPLVLGPPMGTPTIVCATPGHAPGGPPLGCRGRATSSGGSDVSAWSFYSLLLALGRSQLKVVSRRVSIGSTIQGGEHDAFASYIFSRTLRSNVRESVSSAVSVKSWRSRGRRRR
jgi:hypothetical protein